MRVSVPGIPQAILNAPPSFSVKSIPEAIQRLADFVGHGNVTVLTGAGVSVDSGIRAYRGDDGRYMNPNYKPIFYHELTDPTDKGYAFRQRYWLRSYLGYPPVRDAQPNTTHFALAALQYTSHISGIVTQNVDGLHHKALQNTTGLNWSADRIQKSILELHGTLHHVHCSRGHIVDRSAFQERLSWVNPKWHEYAEELERTGAQPRTNPDGDVAVEQLGISYNDFIVPECPECLMEDHRNSLYKPQVIFFGESIPQSVKEKSFQDVEKCDRLLLMGTTLATYSAFRLLKHAVEQKKPVMLLNVGPTRADGMPSVEKIDIPSGAVMSDAVKAIAGSRTDEDPVIVEMLTSGVVNPPSPDDDDRAPRAAG
ncbi:DHS-like NAD/FAD-binding domain-containing protein [Pholiota conissans]|uniref:DHS-like NAD/FAD-binding domain-containing protein n=1 Tax=Pholiota conissans TaxID=109636 RepID=A0A9P5Z0S2_9AGAR|nr:DHS-like NAD/FAD-binding domain-containing protein [Pholiota conissans]